MTLSQTQQQAVRVLRHRGPLNLESLVNALDMTGPDLYAYVLVPLVDAGIVRKTIDQREEGHRRPWFELAGGEVSS